MKELTIPPEATTAKVKVADGSPIVVRSAVKDVPVLFGHSRTLLKFVVVDHPPIDMIIGLPTLDYIQECIEMGNHTFTVTIEEKESVLHLTNDNRILYMEGSDSDSANFISHSEIFPACFSSESEHEKNLIVTPAKDIGSYPT